MLSEHARSLLDDGLDIQHRSRITACLHATATALAAWDALELDRLELSTPEHFEDQLGTEGLPDVRSAMLALRAALSIFRDHFPAYEPPASTISEEDVDAAFCEPIDTQDLIKEHTRAGGTLDRLVAEPVSQEHCNASVGALMAMLREDLARFTKTIKSPSVAHSRWRLVGEVQEFRNSATQCLEAIAAAILRPLSNAPIGELLPRYRTELERSLSLLEALRALSRDIGSINESVRVALPDDLEPLRLLLLQRLDLFARESAYRQLWARDKRVLIQGRLALRQLEAKEGLLMALREQIEGLTRFLELLCENVACRPEVEAYERARVVAMRHR